MSMQGIISGVLVLSCIFSSTVSAADVPEKITCSGKVVDDANRPVPGAKVTLYQFKPDVGEQELNTPIAEEQITKEDGGFSFNAEALPDKQYRFSMLVVTKDGLAIGWDNWQLKEDKITTLAMGKPYTLSGVVVDDAGKPVAGAEVRISMLLLGDPKGGPEKVRYLTGTEPLDFLKTVTDADGVFAFNEIPAEAKAEFVVKKTGRATIGTFKLSTSGGYNPGQYTVQSKDIRIVQPVEARIEGKVVEKDTGKGVGVVKLICVEEKGVGPFDAKPVSKDDGTFSFEGLEAKTYTIRDVPSRDKPAQWVIKPATVTTTAGQTSSGIILEASKGGMLEVTIRDNEKKPVAGANFYVRANDNDKQGVSGVSNADGIAAIRLTPGEYSSQGVYKEGYLSVREQRTVTIEEGKTAKLEFELKGVPKITGVVRDPNGRAVAGASIRICPGGQSITNSDKEGWFEISWNPEQGGGYQKLQPVLVVRHVRQNLAAVVDIDEDTKMLDVNMTPGVVFTGKVVDPNGKPIAGAKVSVTLRVSNYGTPFDNDGVVTDQEGRYEYKAIAEGQKYSVSARADGYGQSYAEVDTDDAINNRLEIAPLTLKAAALSISGIVVDVNDKPMANVEVSVNGQGQQHRRGITDGQGKFTIDKLCDGQVYVNANVRSIGMGSMPMYGNVSAEAGATDVKVVVGSQGRAEMMPNAANQPSGTLEVIVMDDANKPVAGANVNVRGKDSTRGQSGVSNEKGIAMLKLVPGEYEIQRVYKEGYSFAKTQQTLTIEVEKTARVEIELKANPKIIGVVRDPNGLPVARAAMRVFPWGQNTRDSDKGGRFEILQNSEQWGNQEPPPVLVVRHIRRNLAAAVDIDGDTKTLDVNMTPGIVFTGTVVDPNGKPIAGAKINVTLSISGHGMSIDTVGATTDQEGRYEYKAIPTGQQYTISASAEGYGQSYVKIDADDAVNNHLEIKPLTLKVADMCISGIVVDVNDKPVANAEVYVNGQGQQHRRGTTNAQGKFIITKLCDGQVQVNADVSNGPIYLHGNVKAQAGDTDVTVAVAPPNAAKQATCTLETVVRDEQRKLVPKIRGVVSDPNGQPVARAAMRIFPWGQNTRDSDKGGRFEILQNSEQWGDREPQPVLVVRHIRRNLAAAVDIDEDTKMLDVNMTPGIVFTGTVVDPNGKPIAGAKINVTLSISGHGMDIDTVDVTTDQDGRYEYKTVPAGQQYTVSAQFEGYFPSYVKVDADDAVNNCLEIPLLKLKTADMSIAGIVVDANDRPVANARIFVIEDGQQSPDIRTDEQGRFTINKLCVGQVYIYASVKDGQTELYGNAIVSAGDTDVTVVVAPPDTAKQSSSNRAKPKGDPGQFEQSKKALIAASQCTNKEELEAAIDKAKATVDNYEEGHVIVGRVVLDGEGDVRDVAAQMEILPDGCFASETKDLINPVGFRMHRYAPYDLKLKGMKGDLVDVGTIHMTPLTENQLVGLKGTVALEDNGDPSQAVVYLSVSNGPVNTPHNGTSPRRYWPKPIEIQAIENGLIAASGFSPINYWCRVTAPGYLEKGFPIEFSAGQTSDLGTIKLEKPRQILLSYIVAEEPPFDLSGLKTVAIPAGTKWKALDNKECYGWDLEFGQDKGSIIMKAFYAPCFLQDLGMGEIADYVNADKTKFGQNQPWNQKAKNEHVYLLDQEHWKRWVLFKIVIE